MPDTVHTSYQERHTVGIMVPTCIRIQMKRSRLLQAARAGRCASLMENSVGPCCVLGKIFAKCGTLDIPGAPRCHRASLSFAALVARMVSSQRRRSRPSKEIVGDTASVKKRHGLLLLGAIDWFTAWPGDALVAVAKKFLSDVELEESIRPAITSTCQHFHDAVRALSAHAALP